MIDGKEEVVQLMNYACNLKLEKDTMCKIEIEKMHTIRVQSIGEGYAQINEGTEKVVGDTEWVYFEGDSDLIRFIANEYFYINKISIDEKVYYKHDEKKGYKTSYDLVHIQEDVHSIKIEYEKN